MYLSLGKDLSKSNNTCLGPRFQSNILAYPDSIECFFKTSDKYVKFTLTIYSKTMPNYFRLIKLAKDDVLLQTKAAQKHNFKGV